MTDFPGAIDSPLSMGPYYEFDAADRRKIDDQILGLQRTVSTVSLESVSATYFTSGGALTIGDVVCLDGTGRAVLATTAARATAKLVLGVVLTAVSGAGQRVLVAQSGVLPPTATGLSAATSNYVRVSSVGRCEYVASLASTDVGLGFAVLGYLALKPGVAASAASSGPSQLVYPLLASVLTTDLSTSTPELLAMARFDAADYDPPGATRNVTLEAVLATTNASRAATLDLWDYEGAGNSGTPRVVPTSTLTTTQTAPTLLSVDLSAQLGTVPLCLLQGRFGVAAPGGAYVSSYMARLVVTWT